MPQVAPNSNGSFRFNPFSHSASKYDRCNGGVMWKIVGVCINTGVVHHPLEISAKFLCINVKSLSGGASLRSESSTHRRNSVVVPADSTSGRTASLKVTPKSVRSGTPLQPATSNAPMRSAAVVTPFAPTLCP